MSSLAKALHPRRVSVATWSLRERPVCRRLPASPILNGHVNVLVVDIERKLAGIDIGANRIEPRANRLGIALANDALSRKHLGMGLRARNILTIQMLVDRQRCAKLLRDLCHARLKTASPQRHGKPPQIDFKQL